MQWRRPVELCSTEQEQIVDGAFGKSVRHSGAIRAVPGSGDHSTYGVTICSDDWKSITDRSLINVMLSTVSGNCMKMSLDASKKTKGKNFLGDLIVKEIMSLPDPRSVIAVAIDGVNRTSLQLIEEQCPWVSGVICASHSCYLILQDVGDPVHSKVWSPMFERIQEEVRR